MDKFSSQARELRDFVASKTWDLHNPMSFVSNLKAKALTHAAIVVEEVSYVDGIPQTKYVLKFKTNKIVFDNDPRSINPNTTYDEWYVYSVSGLFGRDLNFNPSSDKLERMNTQEVLYAAHSAVGTNITITPEFKSTNTTIEMKLIILDSNGSILTGDGTDKAGGFGSDNLFSGFSGIFYIDGKRAIDPIDAGIILTDGKPHTVKLTGIDLSNTTSWKLFEGIEGYVWDIVVRDGEYTVPYINIPCNNHMTNEFVDIISATTIVGTGSITELPNPHNTRYKYVNSERNFIINTKIGHTLPINDIYIQSVGTTNDGNFNEFYLIIPKVIIDNSNHDHLELIVSIFDESRSYPASFNWYTSGEVLPDTTQKRLFINGLNVSGNTHNVDGDQQLDDMASNTDTELIVEFDLNESSASYWSNIMEEDMYIVHIGKDYNSDNIILPLMYMPMYVTTQQGDCRVGLTINTDIDKCIQLTADAYAIPKSIIEERIAFLGGTDSKLVLYPHLCRQKGEVVSSKSYLEPLHDCTSEEILNYLSASTRNNDKWYWTAEILENSKYTKILKSINHNDITSFSYNDFLDMFGYAIASGFLGSKVFTVNESDNIKTLPEDDAVGLELPESYDNVDAVIHAVSNCGNVTICNITNIVNHETHHEFVLESTPPETEKYIVYIFNVDKCEVVVAHSGINREIQRRHTDFTVYELTLNSNNEYVWDLVQDNLNNIYQMIERNSIAYIELLPETNGRVFAFQFGHFYKRIETTIDTDRNIAITQDVAALHADGDLIKRISREDFPDHAFGNIEIADGNYIHDLDYPIIDGFDIFSGIKSDSDIYDFGMSKRYELGTLGLSHYNNFSSEGIISIITGGVTCIAQAGWTIWDVTEEMIGGTPVRVHWRSTDSVLFVITSIGMIEMFRITGTLFPIPPQTPVEITHVGSYNTTPYNDNDLESPTELYEIPNSELFICTNYDNYMYNSVGAVILKFDFVFDSANPPDRFGEISKLPIIGVKDESVTGGGIWNDDGFFDDDAMMFGDPNGVQGYHSVIVDKISNEIFLYGRDDSDIPRMIIGRFNPDTFELEQKTILDIEFGTITPGGSMLLNRRLDGNGFDIILWNVDDGFSVHKTADPLPIPTDSGSVLNTPGALCGLYDKLFVYVYKDHLIRLQWDDDMVYSSGICQGDTQLSTIEMSGNIRVFVNSGNSFEIVGDGITFDEDTGVALDYIGCHYMFEANLSWVPFTNGIPLISNTPNPRFYYECGQDITNMRELKFNIDQRVLKGYDNVTTYSFVGMGFNYLGLPNVKYDSRGLYASLRTPESRIIDTVRHYNYDKDYDDGSNIVFENNNTSLEEHDAFRIEGVVDNHTGITHDFNWEDTLTNYAYIPLNGYSHNQTKLQFNVIGSDKLRVSKVDLLTKKDGDDRVTLFDHVPVMGDINVMVLCDGKTLIKNVDYTLTTFQKNGRWEYGVQFINSKFYDDTYINKDVSIIVSSEVMIAESTNSVVLDNIVSDEDRLLRISSAMDVTIYPISADATSTLSVAYPAENVIGSDYSGWISEDHTNRDDNPQIDMYFEKPTPIRVMLIAAGNTASIVNINYVGLLVQLRDSAGIPVACAINTNPGNVIIIPRWWKPDYDGYPSDEELTSVPWGNSVRCILPENDNNDTRFLGIGFIFAGPSTRSLPSPTYRYFEVDGFTVHNSNGDPRLDVDNNIGAVVSTISTHTAIPSKQFSQIVDNIGMVDVVMENSIAVERTPPIGSNMPDISGVVYGDTDKVIISGSKGGCSLTIPDGEFLLFSKFTPDAGGVHNTLVATNQTDSNPGNVTIGKNGAYIQIHASEIGSTSYSITDIPVSVFDGLRHDVEIRIGSDRNIHYVIDGVYGSIALTSEGFGPVPGMYTYSNISLCGQTAIGREFVGSIENMMLGGEYVPTSDFVSISSSVERNIDGVVARDLIDTLDIFNNLSEDYDGPPLLTSSIPTLASMSLFMKYHNIQRTQIKALDNAINTLYVTKDLSSVNTLSTSDKDIMLAMCSLIYDQFEVY